MFQIGVSWSEKALTFLIPLWETRLFFFSFEVKKIFLNKQILPALHIFPSYDCSSLFNDLFFLLSFHRLANGVVVLYSFLSISKLLFLFHICWRLIYFFFCIKNIEVEKIRRVMFSMHFTDIQNIILSKSIIFKDNNWLLFLSHNRVQRLFIKKKKKYCLFP